VPRFFVKIKAEAGALERAATIKIRWWWTSLKGAFRRDAEKNPRGRGCYPDFLGILGRQISKMAHNQVNG